MNVQKNENFYLWWRNISHDVNSSKTDHVIMCPCRDLKNIWKMIPSIVPVGRRAMKNDLLAQKTCPKGMHHLPYYNLWYCHESNSTVSSKTSLSVQRSYFEARSGWTKVLSLEKPTTTEWKLLFIQRSEIQLNLKGKVNRCSLCATLLAAHGAATPVEQCHTIKDRS